MKVSSQALAEIRLALREYEKEVSASGVKPNTEKTYLLHANHFVRWLEGDFESGGRVK